jgi:hypothetical protein
MPYALSAFGALMLVNPKNTPMAIILILAGALIAYTDSTVKERS